MRLLVLLERVLEKLFEGTHSHLRLLEYAFSFTVFLGHLHTFDFALHDLFFLDPSQSYVNELHLYIHLMSATECRILLIDGVSDHLFKLIDPHFHEFIPLFPFHVSLTLLIRSYTLHLLHSNTNLTIMSNIFGRLWLDLLHLIDAVDFAFDLMGVI